MASPRFPIGYRFVPITGKRKDPTVYTVADYLVTRRLDGSVVRAVYLVTHNLLGQTVPSEVPEATIARATPAP